MGMDAPYLLDSHRRKVNTDFRRIRNRTSGSSLRPPRLTSSVSASAIATPSDLSLNMHQIEISSESEGLE